MIGHVTSSYLSPTLGRSIAMAVVKGGHQRTGETVQVALSNGTTVRATIGSTVFYDPQSERQNA
jgi:sarcosine oxidase subunit alpha